MTKPAALKPALFVYAFVPAEPPTNRAAIHGYLRDLWLACHALGMEEPIRKIGVGTEAPAQFGPSDGFRLLAAARRPHDGAIYSGFLFSEHDTVGLVAAMAPNDPNDNLSRWQQLHLAWSDAAGGSGPPDGVLGETLAFQALHSNSLETPAAACRDLVGDALPVLGTPSWNELVTVTDRDFLLWEATHEREHSRRRVLCVLAAESDERSLDAWMWTTGSPGLPPLGHYLLHASKVRYEADVYRAMPALRDTKAVIEGELKHLLDLLEDVDEEPRVPTRRLLAAQARLSRLQNRESGLVMGMTQLRELRRTVEIAENNLRLSIPAATVPGGGQSPFDRDVGLARWLRLQAGHHLEYLEALHRRVDEVERFVATRVAESARQQTERLTLFQTSFTGALLMGLTVILAIETKIPMPIEEPLYWPVIAAFTALAFALPYAAFHWAGSLASRGPYRWIDYLAIWGLGAALGWLGCAVTYWYSHETAVPAWLGVLVSCGAGALLAVGTYALSRHRDRVTLRRENRKLR